MLGLVSGHGASLVYSLLLGLFFVCYYLCQTHTNESAKMVKPLHLVTAQPHHHPVLLPLQAGQQSRRACAAEF